MKTVSVEKKGFIACVHLNRPESSNSIIQETFTELTAVAEQLIKDKSIRAIVLTGKGKHFCAGLDLSLFPKEEGSVDWFTQQKDIVDSKGANIFQRCATVWKEIPVPVIAAVNGAAFGGGCQIALGADIRLADGSTKMSLMEVHWGLIPDMAVSQTLPLLTTQDVAAQLLLTAKVLDANEAKSAGLVTSIGNNCLNDAMDMAQLIATKSPQAVRAIKQLYLTSWKVADPKTLQLEAKLQSSLIGSAEQLECIKANFEKREAEFKS